MFMAGNSAAPNDDLVFCPASLGAPGAACGFIDLDV
jgi:hypothetical protein